MQAERLRIIRDKLDQLRVIDKQCRVFGAARGHRYREVRPLDDAELRRLEQIHGVALPDELRAFLARVHGGGPGPGYGLHIGAEVPPDPRLTTRPFPYGNRAVAEFLADRLKDDTALLPLVDAPDDDDFPPRQGFLSLTHLGCDIHSGIVVAGEQRGTIWTCGDVGWRRVGCVGFF